MTRFTMKSVFGFWTFLILLGAYGFLFIKSLQDWHGDAVLTVRSFSLLGWLVMIVLAGVSSVDAARFSTENRAYLLIEKTSTRRTFFFLFMSTFVPVAIVHILAVCAGLILTESVVRSPFTIVLAVTAQLTSLAWAIVFGSVLGRFLHPLVAGPVAAVAMFLLVNTLMGQSFTTNRVRILGDTGATVSQTGLTWNTTHLTAQILVLMCTLAVMLMVTDSHSARCHFPTSKTTVAGVACMCLLATAALTIPGTPMVRSNAQPDYCINGEVEVCIFKEHVDFAQETIDSINKLVAAAKHNDYDALVPTKIVEATVRGWETSVDPNSGIRFIPSISPKTHGTAAYIAQYLSMPLWCTELYSLTPPPDQYFTDQSNVAMTWLSIAGLGHQGFEGATLLSADDVESIMTRWATCKLQ